MKGKMIKRILSSVLALAMTAGGTIFSTVSAETEFEDISIDFEEFEVDEEYPHSLYGTVTEFEGSNVLKIGDGKTSYLNTGISADSLGKYELKFSVFPSMPSTITTTNSDTEEETTVSNSDLQDFYLFAFDGVTAYSGTNTIYRLGYFADTSSITNGLWGFHNNSNALSTNHNNHRIFQGGTKMDRWYDFTVIFDQATKKVQVTVASKDVEFNASTYKDADGTEHTGTTTTGSYTYEFIVPDTAYFNRFVIGCENNNESCDAICYVDDISIREVDEFTEINVDFADYELGEASFSGATGTVVNMTDGRRALKMTAAGELSVKNTAVLSTGITADRDEKYVIKFSVLPENTSGIYVCSFNGAECYLSTASDSNIYRIAGFNTTGNMFGWSSAYTATNFQFSGTADIANGNRLKYGYTSQWYDVTAVFDHAADNVDVTIVGADSVSYNYNITLPEKAYLKELQFLCRGTGDTSVTSTCYIDDISVKKFAEPEFESISVDFADYDMDTNEYGFGGTVNEIDGRKAMLLPTGVTSIDTGISKSDTDTYRVKFSVRPEVNTENYLATFNGEEAYDSNIANSTIYKIIGFQNKNLFGWSSNANAWGTGYNNNRLKIGYTAGQWYETEMILDHVLNCAKVTVTAEDGSAWTYYMVNLPEGAYFKTLDFRCEDTTDTTGTPTCYIDDISIEKYTGDYGYMTSCDGVFNEAGTTEITAFTDATNKTGFADQAAGTKFTAKVNYINPTKDEQNLICMIAYYDWDEGIRAVEVADAQIISAESAGCYMPVFTIPDMTDVRGVKILMWNSLTNASPISSAMKPY